MGLFTGTQLAPKKSLTAGVQGKSCVKKLVQKGQPGRRWEGGFPTGLPALPSLLAQDHPCAPRATRLRAASLLL